MARLYPGDYLRDVTITAIDAVQGAGMFTWRKQRCFLLNRDVPLLTLQPGLQIGELVCIGRDKNRKRWQCAPPGCFSRLARELYSNGRGKIIPYIRNKYKNLWLNRWRQAADSPGSILCVPVPMVNKNAALSGRTWMALHADDWQMPVATSVLHDALAGQPRFFPAPLQRSWKQSRVYAVTGQPVYRNDNLKLSKNSPLQVRLRCLSNYPKLRDDLPVNLYIHPPVHPNKQHFTAKKHMFCDKKTSAERQYWRCLFKYLGYTTIPGLEEIKNIFHGCVANQQNTNCLPCDIGQFKQTHAAIRGFIDEAIKLSVTFLQDRITERNEGSLITLEEIFPFVFGVQMALQDKMPWSRQCAEAEHRFVYRGLLYVDPEQYCGSLHLSPLTQYMITGRISNILFGNNLILGKLYHVSTSN